MAFWKLMASLEAENHTAAAFRVCLKMNTNLFTQVKGLKTSSDMIEKPAGAEKCVCGKCVWKCKDSPDLLIEVLQNQTFVCTKQTAVIIIVFQDCPLSLVGFWN